MRISRCSHHCASENSEDSLEAHPSPCGPESKAKNPLRVAEQTLTHSLRLCHLPQFSLLAPLFGGERCAAEAEGKGKIHSLEIKISFSTVGGKSMSPESQPTHGLKSGLC